jgi:hypothetical protein
MAKTSNQSNQQDTQSFKDQRDILKEINSEIGKQNNALQEAAKSYSVLQSVAFKLQNAEEEISTLNEKQLKDLKAKSQIALRELKSSAEQLKNKQNLSSKERALLKAAKEKFSIEEEFVKKVEEELESYEKINKQLGVVGGVLKGISKIPILGDVFDANEALDAARKKVKETGSGVKGLGAAFGNIGSQLSSGLLNPANVLTSVIGTMVSVIMEADKATGDLAKGMNITYDQATGVRDELNRIAALSGDSALNTRALQESLTAVNNELGTAGQLSESDLKTFTKLREQAGMTNEEILDMQKYSMATGGSLKENVESFQASAKIMSYQKGVALNTKKLMADMANTSNRTKLSIQGGAAGLAKAAVAAKLMGGDLSKAADIADQLLDFESSIENELSAELLLGKDINLEKARQAALNNDLATVAEEITQQAGSAAEFSQMNRIQQEAMAKAVGMTADQLADTLVEQEALKSIGKALNEDEQKAFDAAKQKYGLEEASKMLQEGQLDNMVTQQSKQEQISQQLEKIKETFVTMAPSILGMVDGLIGMLDVVNTILMPVRLLFDFFGYIGKGISNLIGPLGTVGKLFKGIASLAVVYAAYAAYASLAAIPVVGVPLGLAASAGILAAGFGLLGSIKDGAINPKGGLIVSGEKGSIQLDKEDSIIAGTNLFGNDTKSESNKSSQPSGRGEYKINGDSSAVVNAIAELRRDINALANRPINVSIDGKKVIEATTGNQPNTVGDESRKNSYQIS